LQAEDPKVCVDNMHIATEERIGLFKDVKDVKFIWLSTVSSGAEV